MNGNDVYSKVEALLQQDPVPEDAKEQLEKLLPGLPPREAAAYREALIAKMGLLYFAR